MSYVVKNGTSAVLLAMWCFFYEFSQRRNEGSVESLPKLFASTKSTPCALGAAALQRRRVPCGAL